MNYKLKGSHTSIRVRVRLRFGKRSGSNKGAFKRDSSSRQCEGNVLNEPNLKRAIQSCLGNVEKTLLLGAIAWITGFYLAKPGAKRRHRARSVFLPSRFLLRARARDCLDKLLLYRLWVRRLSQTIPQFLTRTSLPIT